MGVYEAKIVGGSRRVHLLAKTVYAVDCAYTNQNTF